MKWQQAYHRTKANKITRVTTSERGQKNLLQYYCTGNILLEFV